MVSDRVGLRIYEDFGRLPRTLVDAFGLLPTSVISDAMNRLYCMNGDICLMSKPLVMVGTAFTVKTITGDNLLDRALDLAKSGDVIVVDGPGSTERVLAGEIMMTFALNKGLSGFVVDGAIRDAQGVKALDIPVYAKAVNPKGPFKNGPGEINVPICCGGIVVLPGDIIVGDLDGIVVIRKDDAEEILTIAKQNKANDEAILEQYHSGILNAENHYKKFKDLTKRTGFFIPKTGVW